VNWLSPGPGTLVVCALLAVGCGPELEPTEELGVQQQAIFRGPNTFGDVARVYPEFVTFNSGGKAWCSGVLLDSQVVLSAGHCFTGAYTEVTRDGIGRHAVDRHVLWGAGLGADQVDLVLYHLTTPIHVGVQPELEPALWMGDLVSYVGRIDHGTMTNSGHGIRGRTVSWIGGEKAQSQWSVLQRGDSGGPVYLDHTRRLVGVNSYLSGASETPGSADGFTRLHPDLARAVQNAASGFGGPGTSVRIHWGR
jgi:hypothetical protein